MSDWIGYEPGNAGGGGGGGGGYSGNLLVLTAGTNLATHVPVALDPGTGHAILIANTELSMENMIGFTQAAATVGNPVTIYLPGQTIPGFVGLTPGAYLAYSGTIASAGVAIPGATWFRNVGTAVTTTALDYVLGPTTTTL
jgi:hypothetical protein